MAAAASTSTRTGSGTSLDDKAATGEFVRKPTQFHGVIRADAAAADDKTTFAAAAGRYVLYVSLACPWASRCMLVRELKGLQEAIDVCVVEPKWGGNDAANSEARGWLFGEGATSEAAPDGASHYRVTADSEGRHRSVRDLYLAAQPDYEGRYTVPVLYDRTTRRIVNNESSEIIRMFNAEFNAFARHPERDFYPAPLRAEIDRLDELMYNSVCNGVYRCGFAGTQQAYEKAFGELFGTLDTLEATLADRRFLTGTRFTEADIRLFVTLVRFDAVYHTHFKTNLRRIVDYPNLWAWLRDVYHLPGVAATVSMRHIKNHYFGSHPTINPLGIVPLGPAIDFDQPQQRSLLGKGEPAL